MTIELFFGEFRDSEELSVASLVNLLRICVYVVCVCTYICVFKVYLRRRSSSNTHLCVCLYICPYLFLLNGTCATSALVVYWELLCIYMYVCVCTYTYIYVHICGAGTNRIGACAAAAAAAFRAPKCVYMYACICIYTFVIFFVSALQQIQQIQRCSKYSSLHVQLLMHVCVCVCACVNVYIHICTNIVPAP